jgi:hypothetical protein
MNTPEVLKKTAAVLRQQEEEKTALNARVESLEKDSNVKNSVINMLKEGLLDVEEIDAKIAEFNSNPELLKDTVGFFNKTSGVGSVSEDVPPVAGKAEESFWSTLMGA